MNRARRQCSGVFMDGKLFVIGGKGSNNEELTCGEEYDFELGSWRVIENMTEGLNVRVKTAGAPPLVAVVNNDLYGADYAEKNVKKYDKQNSRWITLGRWPESIASSSMNGWGICFKACGAHDWRHKTDSGGANGDDKPPGGWHLAIATLLRLA
nr:unnamed protein product [Digitaria exilis]